MRRSGDVPMALSVSPRRAPARARPGVPSGPVSTTARGFTAVELVVVCAVVGVLCAVAVPSAVGARRALGCDGGARHLALVLRAAQARAQSGEGRTAVQVAADGSYLVAHSEAGGWRITERGRLLVPVTTNYPSGRVEFGRAGWPRLSGTATPRAGRVFQGGGSRTRTVVVPRTGCVRCR